MTERTNIPKHPNNNIAGAQSAEAWLVPASWRPMLENIRASLQLGRGREAFPHHYEVKAQEYHLEFGQSWAEDLIHFHLIWRPHNDSILHLHLGDQTGIKDKRAAENLQNIFLCYL